MLAFSVTIDLSWLGSWGFWGGLAIGLGAAVAFLAWFFHDFRLF